MCLLSGDNILTAVSVARQCGLVPAEDRLVFVNAYSPDGGAPARIDWVCHDDSGRGVDTAPGSIRPDEVIVMWALYYVTVNYDTVYLMCSRKLTSDQRSLPHGKVEVASSLVGHCGWAWRRPNWPLRFPQRYILISFTSDDIDRKMIHILKCLIVYLELDWCVAHHHLLQWNVCQVVKNSQKKRSLVAWPGLPCSGWAHNMWHCRYEPVEQCVPSPSHMWCMMLLPVFYSALVGGLPACCVQLVDAGQHVVYWLCTDIPCSVGQCHVACDLPILTNWTEVNTTFDDRTFAACATVHCSRLMTRCCWDACLPIDHGLW